MIKKYVYALGNSVSRTKGGSKAKNLHFLMQHHFPVPTGWVVSCDALADYQQLGDEVLNTIQNELSQIIKSDRLYAVRSSASVEDDDESSCAGLFHSFLGIQSLEQVMEKIMDVWESLSSNEYKAYSQKRNISEKAIRMGVIIQEMVEATCSGVAFSKNPLTGLSETILEAGQGTGEEQANLKRDPERWVSKWGNWLQRPEKGMISEQLAGQLVAQTSTIAKKYDKPVDLEWAFDGRTLYFLQVRPITQMDIPIFSNRIAKEMIPGIIKPLVWSINTRLINQVWVNILIRLTGDHSFKQEELTGHYYYRAYFNMAVFGRVFEKLGLPYEALELLLGLEQDGPDKPHMRPGMGIMSKMTRMFGFVFGFIGIERKLNRLLRDKKHRYQQMIDQINPGQSPEILLDWIEQIHEETGQVAYYNIMIPMLAMMYHRLLTNLLKKNGYDIRLLDLNGVAEAVAQYSPHQHLEKLQQKYHSIDLINHESQGHLLDQDLETFLKEFGHFCDSGNDCSSIPWRETPELIRQMIMQPIQPRPSAGKSLTYDELEIPWFRCLIIHFIYQRASRYAVHREAISSLYTFGYGHFRTGLLFLGRQLTDAGVLDQSEDIFYLYWQELTELVQQKNMFSQKDLIAMRKQDLESYRDAALPETIFGLEQPPVTQLHETAISGIPTSLGTYTGPARVLQGLKDFERMNHGDVLIIPYSDVGWTPLFAKAGAVVAESGGILSHSSIVAREYRIPAVVSVHGACRIPDGTIITVNGHNGQILIGEGIISGICADS